MKTSTYSGIASSGLILWRERRYLAVTEYMSCDKPSVPLHLVVWQEARGLYGNHADAGRGEVVLHLFVCAAHYY